MANTNTILATSSDGDTSTVSQIQNFLLNKEKTKLAQFIWDRLYGRYLRPFEFPSSEYQRKYKSGFLLMASCCLLIETYVSFRFKKYRSTKNQSGACFGEFFTSEPKFLEFSDGARQPNGRLSTAKQGGTPNDFYANVRCGILHSAETKNGWTITRSNTSPLFNKKTKQINATVFANRLKAVLKGYQAELLNSNFDTDEIWINFKTRLNDLIRNT